MNKKYMKALDTATFVTENMRLMHKSIFCKKVLEQSLMSSSVEGLNDTPRVDFALLTLVRSTTAQVRKNKFSMLVQRAYCYKQ